MSGNVQYLGQAQLVACSSDRKELIRLASPDRATTAVVMQEAGGGAAISSTYFVYLSDGQGQLGKSNLSATYAAALVTQSVPGAGRPARKSDARRSRRGSGSARGGRRSAWNITPGSLRSAAATAPISEIKPWLR